MAKLKLVTLVQTCTACPSQWEGCLEDGRYIYARYRWGHLSVRAGPTPDDAVFGEDEIFEGSPEGADSFDGWMDTEQMLELANLEYDGDVEEISRIFVIDTKTGESKAYEGDEGLKDLLEDLKDDNDESSNGTRESGEKI